jgi:hydrogenase maturation protease
MRAVVLGIGNTILSDEAAGVRAVEALERGWILPENVVAIDGGTSGMEMIEDLSDLDFLVVLDVVKTGAAPGTVVRIAGDEIPVFFRSKLSPHQIASARRAGQPGTARTHAEGNRGARRRIHSLELGMEMTPTVAEKVPVLAAMAADELRARGYAVAANEEGRLRCASPPLARARSRRRHGRHRMLRPGARSQPDC